MEEQQMKKILSLVAIAGLLVSTVPSSYAGNDPLYLNHKLDTMTINTEKLENLETTHMLSNAFSFLYKGVKAVGSTVKSAFCKFNEFIAEKEAKATEIRGEDQLCRCNRQPCYAPNYKKAIEIYESTMAITAAYTAMRKEYKEEKDLDRKKLILENFHKILLIYIDQD
jgi:hypothetical protein